MTHLETFLLLLPLLATSISASIQVTNVTSNIQDARQDNNLKQSLDNAYSVIDTPPLDILDRVDYILDPNDKINVYCPEADKVLVSMNEHPIATIERTKSGFYKRVINKDYARVTSFDGTNAAPRIVVQVMQSGTVRCFDFKTANNTQSTVVLYDNVSVDQHLIIGKERYLIGDGATAILNGKEAADIEFTVTSLLGRECICESNITTGIARNTASLALTRAVKNVHQTTYNTPLWPEDSSSIVLIATCCGGSYGNSFCLQASFQTKDKSISIPALNQSHVDHPPTTSEPCGERNLSTPLPTFSQDKLNNSSCTCHDQDETFNKSLGVQDPCCLDEALDVKDFQKDGERDLFVMNWMDAVLIGIGVGTLNLILVGTTVFAIHSCLKAQRKLKETVNEKNG
jgi:hypothetical protein